MSVLTLRAIVRRLGGATLLSLAGLFTTGAHAQVADWQSNVSSCVPANDFTITAAQVVPAGGYVRAPLGPNPPLIYTCNVLDSYNVIVPVWNFMRLQFNSPVAGSVTAALYAKDKVTGVSVLQALVANPASAGVANVQVALPALNFAANSHFIVVTLFPQQNFRVQAHMVTALQ
jgi:hypothetical protein